MGEKVYGYHAIEEGLKKAGMGSTLYLVRNGGEKINRLEMAAKCTGKVAVKKLDQAAAKGLIHKNNAAHKKSQLVNKLNKAN